jgi:hypothetical protein
LPGAAIVARNIISYNSPKKKESRTTRRRESDEVSEDNPYGTKVIKVKAGAATRVSLQNKSTHSNNTSIGVTQDHQGSTYKTSVERKDSNIDNLLEDLNLEESQNLPTTKRGAKQTSIVYNAPEPGARNDAITPLNDNDLGFMESNNNFNDQQASNIIQFVQDDEPENNMFNFGLENTPEDRRREAESNINKEKSPNQFRMTELLNDFGIDEENDEIAVKASNPKPQEDDFLNEFEWD